MYCCHYPCCRRRRFPQLLYSVRPSVDAVLSITNDADLAFILAGLVNDTSGQRDELGEIAAVQFELLNLFASDSRTNFRGLRVYLRHIFASNGNFLGYQNQWST